MLETAKRAALAGGAVLRKYFSQELEFRQKQDSTFVSIADEESEAVIKEIILAAYPGHSINGEETGVSGEGNIIWHVDPLDGTVNFKSGFPYSAVSIGIEKDGEFVIGVIYNPFSDELFYAEKGCGAFCNGKPLHVSSLSMKEGVHVIDASFKDDRASRKHAYIGDLISAGSRLRMIGSNALQLAEVASGKCASSLSDAVHSYDFAAGVVIVQEAGGIVTDQQGNAPRAESAVIIAANTRENHAVLLSFARHYDGYRGM